MSALLARIEALAEAERLMVMGGFAAEPADALPEGTRTIILLGPAEPGFWAHLTAGPEWRDGAPDPVDRWSARVIGAMAQALDGQALFPFGGPPWHPIHAWAIRTGRAWESPVRLLVHDRAGLFASYRGALALREAVVLPEPGPSPCEGCPAPCLTACPVAALTGAGYDLPRCHAYLSTPPGQECMDGGCQVRRACPVSRTYGRLPAQSAYHMRQFHR